MSRREREDGEREEGKRGGREGRLRGSGRSGRERRVRGEGGKLERELMERRRRGEVRRRGEERMRRWIENGACTHLAAKPLQERARGRDLPDPNVIPVLGLSCISCH